MTDNKNVNEKKFNEVPSQVNYKNIEASVLKFWQDKKIFERSKEKPAPSGEFVFYEGPPTANGQPAMHHVLARAFKDLFPRYKTMRGFHVTRKGGWDTHGLPVEISVEKKMGLQGRNHGGTRNQMEEFNKLCRESVFTNIQDWNYFTERLGYWVDLDSAYVTFRNEYIESVWNVLQRLWNMGLVEQDFKVVPVSPRIGSTLSKAELGDENSYQMVDDPSVYVRFPVKTETTPAVLREQLKQQGMEIDALQDLALLIWTTTPWTLPSNTMAAVNPELDYVIVKTEQGHLVIAANAVERIGALHKDAAPPEILATFKGSQMEWWQYTQPFPDVFEEFGLNAQKYLGENPRAHFVALADFVGDEDGSGIAHEAPVYGAEDLELSKRYGALLCFGTNGNGIMQVTDERGKFFKDADKGLIKDLKQRGLMYFAGTLKHRYPFHDRTGDPILYFARPSWFVRTNKMASKLVEQNQKINWVPPHIKDGRFGKWLENNVDWGISRERYWGTPLPFWRSEDGQDFVCVGSVRELEELSGQNLQQLDLHRPYVDDVSFVKNGKTYRRVPEVLDVWFDSGAMPLAQWHVLLGPDGAPQNVAHHETFKKHFPADFICEAIDQTRGWFNSLHVISTLLHGEPCFKNVICLGHLVDEKGQKMSKSKGNVVEPLPAFDKYGADSVRWYMFTASEPGDNKKFSLDLIGEAQRGFVNTLWNVYSFFVLYANLDQPDLSAAPAVAVRPEIDRWLLASLENVKSEMTNHLDTYNARAAGKVLEAFVESLSNWYVRRNRRRFWSQDGNVDLAAYATLHEVLVECSKLAAPFTPFMAEAIYQNLVQEKNVNESVHLCEWPRSIAANNDDTLVREMAAVLKVVDLGRAARGQAKLKLRQPLREVMVRARDAESTIALARLSEQIAEELNVKLVSPLADATGLVSYGLRPNLPVLGRKYGKIIPAIKAALDASDASDIATKVRLGESFTLQTTEGELELGPEDVLVDAKSPEGMAAIEDAGFVVAFDATLTPELIFEGLSRDLIRGIQQARKDAGFDVSDRIEVRLNAQGDWLSAAKEWQEHIAAEVLASKIEFASPLPTDFVVKLEDDAEFGVAKAT